MKAFWVVSGLLIGSAWADTGQLPRSPLSSDTPDGKQVYAPIAPPIDPKAEKTFQQEEAIRGGRNEPMHRVTVPIKDIDAYRDYRCYNGVVVDRVLDSYAARGIGSVAHSDRKAGRMDPKS